MTEASLSFIHRFVPAQSPSLPTLLVLHGTGGDENDLLPLGQALAPGAALLSPRGKVLENGMPRFFRRLAMGVFDEQDLRFRTQELAEFLRAASSRYGFDLGNVVAAGYSN
ncbi:MAG TPA: alpha/beta hydrolase, partial [Terriglobia bacterium]|nr:alpha/beta hydrolase [Terriglobia bacterium]